MNKMCLYNENVGDGSTKKYRNKEASMQQDRGDDGMQQ